MLLSINWLREYVNIDMPHEELARMMTMAGLEVEGIEPIGHGIEGVIVAKIMSVKRHPEADRLFICHMDTGKGDLQVVCSAPNLSEGIAVPMALPGITLPGGIKVKESKIRGTRSVGMLLAEDEMGLTDDHTGIMVLPQDLEIGADLSSALPVKDHILDISLTPNRPDCASVIGIAREVAALTGQRIKMPEIKFDEGTTPIEDLVSITIDDPVGCPRYAVGLIQGVELKPSPFWIRSRLFSSGVRSINNVVDISNYVLMEYGQPLHTFDYDRLKMNQIIVRRADDGESFTTLDGQSRSLNKQNLMICDGERSVALAGVMGGLNSEIFEGSKNVLIESAFFDPMTIRRGSKRLGLLTEASYRFERGIDIEGVITALKRAQMLIIELAGGTSCKGIIDNYPKPHKAPIIDLRIKKTNDFLGTRIPKESFSHYLDSLDMKVSDLDDDTLRVSPPSFRVDITREIDLVEEVARMDGYDNIPVTYPPIRPSDEIRPPALILRDQVCDIMAGLGFSEVINYSFISPDSVDHLFVEEDSHLRLFVHLMNPLTTEQSVMRTSLVPGILSTMKANITHDERDLKLFEWGKIFFNTGNDELPLEELHLCAAISGRYMKKEWYNDDRTVDFYDIKGAVEVLLSSLGIEGIMFKREGIPSFYNPETSCSIFYSDRLIGTLGEVRSDVSERFEIKADEIYLFDLNIETLLDITQKASKKFVPYAKFPAVYRDISIVVNKNIDSAVILHIIERIGADLVESVNLFDMYKGSKMDPDLKALSFRICYRSKEGTLHGKKVNQLHESVINGIMAETGGRLRQG